MRPKLVARSLASYQDKCCEDWTRGLPARPANALKRYGFSSRAEVAAVPQQVLWQVEGLGRGGMAELMSWLRQREDDTEHRPTLAETGLNP